VQLPHYLGLLHRSLGELAEAYREVSDHHAAEPDVHEECRMLAERCDQHVARLAPIAERYGEDADDEPERLHQDLFSGVRTGGLGLLRDLHDLYLLATECELAWTVVGQAAQGARDEELLTLSNQAGADLHFHLAWLLTRVKQAAPQALVVA
jgi:hypothetical protein